MRLTCRSTLTLALVAALPAACGDKERNAEGDARMAAGEVRGGTISDDMLPLDTVKSQSPPLKQTSTEGGDKDVQDDAAEAAAEEGQEGVAEAQPAPVTEPVSEED